MRKMIWNKIKKILRMSRKDEHSRGTTIEYWHNNTIYKNDENGERHLRSRLNEVWEKHHGW